MSCVKNKGDNTHIIKFEGTVYVHGEDKLIMDDIISIECNAHIHMDNLLSLLSNDDFATFVELSK